VQVAAQLAVASGLDLMLTPAGRGSSGLAADLTKRGIPARADEAPTGAVVVAPASSQDQDGGVHLSVTAGSIEASDDLDQWVAALDGRIQQESRQQ
jgi:hypothetical protein